MTTPSGYTPDPYYATYEPSLAWEDPGTKVLLSHTGTLDTTGHGNGDTERTGTNYGVEVHLGADTSAAAINPYLDPDIDTANLPDGYAAGPLHNFRSEDQPPA